MDPLPLFIQFLLAVVLDHYLILPLTLSNFIFIELILHLNRIKFFIKLK